MTSDFALTDNISLLRDFTKSLLSLDGDAARVQLFGGGKVLKDEPILNFGPLRNGGSLMVKVRPDGQEYDNSPVTEEQQQAVPEPEPEPPAPEEQEGEEEWWKALPDAAPCRWNEELRAFECSPCVKNDDGTWTWEGPDIGTSIELNADAPDFCEGRWEREYFISEEEWKRWRPKEEVQLAFRFPAGLLLEDDIRFSRSANQDYDYYPRWGGVLVRPEREQMTSKNAMGRVLVAKKTGKKVKQTKFYRFDVVEDGQVLLLTVRDLKGKIKPNVRMSLVKMLEPIPLCGACSKDQDDEDDNEIPHVFCDECADFYHLSCLEEELTLEDVKKMAEWYCPQCKNKFDPAHQLTKKVTESKVAKAAEAGARKGAGKSNQSWKSAFKGTVAPNRTGPVFGCLVGQHELNRTDFAIMGVHQNHMSSFVMSKTRPPHAVSITLSGKGSYESRDLGDVVVTDGPGGRDLSGEKGDKNARTGKLKNDQAWSGALGHNIAMARSCAAFHTFFECSDCSNPLFGEKEFESKPFKPGKNAICKTCQGRWREGVPLRLVRGGQDGNQFAPNWGYRYDGIYKVRQFWMEEREPAEETKPKKKKAKKGEEKEEEEEEEKKEKAEKKEKVLVKVCCFELVRDDEVPAPWTAAGKATTKRYGLDLPPRNMYRKKVSSSMKLTDLQRVADTVPDLAEDRPKGKKDLYEALVASGKVGDVELVPDGVVVREDFKAPPIKDTDHPTYAEWQRLWRADQVHAAFWKDEVEKPFESGEFCLRSKGFFAFVDALRTKYTCAICMEVAFKGFRLTSCCMQVLCDGCIKSSPHSECPFCRADSKPVSAAPEIFKLLQLVFEAKFFTEASAKKKKLEQKQKKAAAKKQKFHDGDDDEEENEFVTKKKKTTRKRTERPVADEAEKKSKPTPTPTPTPTPPPPSKSPAKKLKPVQIEIHVEL